MTDEFTIDELEDGMRRAGVDEFTIHRVMVEALPLVGPRETCRMIGLVEDEAPAEKYHDPKPPSTHLRRRIR